MDRPEFEITISKSGRVTVEVKGVKGARCLQYADLIKEIVGREDHRRLTNDYYAQEGQVRIDTRVHDSSAGG
jgi:hypothetical protein